MTPERRAELRQVLNHYDENHAIDPKIVELAREALSDLVPPPGWLSIVPIPDGHVLALRFPRIVDVQSAREAMDSISSLLGRDVVALPPRWEIGTIPETEGRLLRAAGLAHHWLNEADPEKRDMAREMLAALGHPEQEKGAP